MKIAFLILAHGNIKQLNCFIRQLLKYPESYIYIHIDIKAGNADESIIKNDRVFITPKRFSLNWGDPSLNDATRYLISFALNNQYHDYYSLHSGVDMALKPVSEYAEFLESDNKFFYASYASLPMSGWGYGGGLGRFALKWPKLFRKKVGRKSLIRIMRGIYGRLYDYSLIKKIFPVPKKSYSFYGGSEWFTASSLCIERSLEFLKNNNDYDEIFMHSISSDEIYTNTVFEAIKDSHSAVSNNNLRYTSWSVGKRDGVGGPKIFTIDDLDKIENSGKFFARKFDLNYDRKIVEYFEAKS